MREYDPYKPLIHIHLPKTGGVTVKEIYKNWFKQGLLFHYYNEPEQKLPVKYDLEKLHNINSPICVFGHFNKARDFGIKDYYPDVNQFITILRDPFEKAISGYFFLKKNNVPLKEGKKGFIYILVFSAFLLGFFTLMIQITK